jgi:DNA-binding GntR family transcriptional regulator
MRYEMASEQTNSIVPKTRSEAVAGELRRMIQSGELAPGTRLRQADIAARVGMSTTPVREAFMILAREGAVRQDAHRGVVVFKPSLDELTETYEIREALEPLATELAAKGLTNDDLEAIDTIIEQMRSAKPRRYVELNRDFHRRIYDAAGRPRLLEMIEQLRDIASSYIGLTVHEYDPAYRDQVQREHEAIRDALRKRDAKRAGRLVRDHLRHNARQVATIVERTEPR